MSMAINGAVSAYSNYPKMAFNKSSYEPVLPQDGKVDFTAQNRIRGNDISGLDGLREAVNSWNSGKVSEQNAASETNSGANAGVETPAKEETNINFKDLMESMSSTGRASLGRAFSKLDNMSAIAGGFGFGNSSANSVNMFQSYGQYQSGGAYNQGMFNQLLNAYA
jgi:hypothetical protein